MLMLALAACQHSNTDEPPAVRYDVDECVECGMILSDERYTTAIMTPGPRGPEALLFDDLNCQVNYEFEHPDLVILKRWTHDQGTRAWIDTPTAHFVRAKELYTPMMSHVAAFAQPTDAEALAQELHGELLDFTTLWASLRPAPKPAP